MGFPLCTSACLLRQSSMATKAGKLKRHVGKGINGDVIDGLHLKQNYDKILNRFPPEFILSEDEGPE